MSIDLDAERRRIDAEACREEEQGNYAIAAKLYERADELLAACADTWEEVAHNRGEALVKAEHECDELSATLDRVRELLTETDWSGVLYDNDVLGAIAEAVGVERQD